MPTESLADDIRRRAGWSMLMGVLTALLGLFLIAYPLATATVTTVLLGWVLIFAAITQIVFALHSQTIGRFFAKVLLAVLYGLAGIGLAFFPMVGVSALTMMLGTLLLVYAGVEAATAFEVRPVEAALPQAEVAELEAEDHEILRSHHQDRAVWQVDVERPLRVAHAGTRGRLVKALRGRLGEERHSAPLRRGR